MNTIENSILDQIRARAEVSKRAEEDTARKFPTCQNPPLRDGVPSGVFIPQVQVKRRTFYVDTGEENNVLIGLSFGSALDALKKGLCVARKEWGENNVFVYLVQAKSSLPKTKIDQVHFGSEMVTYSAYMAIKNANNTVSVWTPSVDDCLGEDWVIVDKMI